MLYNFIILSSCDWGDMLQRPHHISRALAGLGHTVNFIEFNKIRCKSEQNFKDHVDYCISKQRVIESISIMKCAVVSAANGMEFDNTPAIINKMIGRSERKTVIIVYLPWQVNILKNISGGYKLVYDCVDDHTDLTYSYWSRKSDISDEGDLLNKSDIVLASSSALYLSKCIGRENVFLSRNAVNIEDFIRNDNCDEPEDLSNIPHPRICYTGAVFEWFDEELFYKTVDANTDKSFVVLGPVSEKLLKIPRLNLHILGIKKHSVLRDYLYGMDVGIIPFKDDIDLIIHCNPIKMYEYLACGLPVVSTALPELYIGQDFVKVCKGANSFIKSIDLVLSNKKFAKDRIKNFISNNTWVVRANQLIQLLEGNTDENKESTLAQLQKSWEDISKDDWTAVLRSLYSLSFQENDPKKYLEIAKEAFDSLDVNFTFKNYVYSLYLNDRFEEAVHAILISSGVSDINKADLVWAYKEGKKELLKIKILLCINRLDLIERLIENLEDEDVRVCETVHFRLETGKSVENIPDYTKLLKADSINASPSFNNNVSRYLGYHESRKCYFKTMRLIDEYLQKENRIEKWNSIFTNAVPCNLCGSSEFRGVIERPDGLRIVACKSCSLSRLEKMPETEKLLDIYDPGYFDNAATAGCNCSNNAQDNSFLFNPRLKWIEKTLFNKNGRKLLDIGCSNGQFLECAGRFGWKCYGVELSRVKYQEASKKGIPVYNSELKDICFDGNDFDCVTLWDTIEHFISPLDVLKEIYRILKPDGQIYISTPNHLKGIVEGSDWFGYNVSFEHLYYFEAATLIKMLITAGFKIDSCFSHERGDWDIIDTKTIGHFLLVSARK